MYIFLCVVMAIVIRKRKNFNATALYETTVYLKEIFKKV